MKKIFYIFLALTFPFVGMAQDLAPCGTVQTEEDLKELRAFQKAYYNGEIDYERDNVLKYIPVMLHQIRKANGSGGMLFGDLIDRLCLANEQYAGSNSDIMFTWDGIRVHQNDAWYDSHDNFIYNQKVPNKVNVFVANHANGACGFYTPPANNQTSDYVFIAKSCLQDWNITLAHELGHLLGLPHNFSGWEGTEYNCNTSAPVWAEKFDGSNCSTAGDGFCDTPPDYISDRWDCNSNDQSNCVLRDANGDTGNAPGTFYMCYSNDDCSSTSGGFSNDQVAAMQNHISSIRGNISFTNPTWSDIMDDATVLQSPINEEQLEYNNWIRFEFDPVPNATHYLVEIATTPIFNIVPDYFLTTETVIDHYKKLLDNKTYYWRVRPMNRGNFCTNYTSQNGSFVTSAVSAVTDVAGLQAFSVFPNPAPENSNVQVKISLKDAIDVQIQLLSIDGKVVQNEKRFLNAGHNDMILNTDNLESGMYFLSLQTKDGVTTEKIIIE